MARESRSMAEDLRRAAGGDGARESAAQDSGGQGGGGRNPGGGRSRDDQAAPFAMVGLVTGMLGLVLAVFSPWILGALAASTDASDGIVVEGVRDGDGDEESGSWIERAKRWKVKLSFGGDDEDEAPSREPSATDRARTALPPVTLGFGLLGILFGMVGLIRRERSLIGGFALGLGTATIIVQLTMLFVGLIIAAVILAVILGVLGFGSG